jgi:Flp pilus assembly protein TadG
MSEKKKNADRRSFLTRLRRDETGNTIAVMAAALIPTIGFIGGGVDMSRIYLTQTRLQAACDAGSLVGRKTMGVGTWAGTDNSYAARTAANNMFDANIDADAYGITSMTRTYTETGGNVTGVATATVPMALMKVLPGQPDIRTITVTCQSELRIPNTDVMFVLDTTGSMAGTRIAGLKVATKCFYEALAKENIDDVTPANCGETTDPSSANAANVQLRFGFVPYAENVNVGRLLPLNYMATNWTYQSRQANFNGAVTYVPHEGTPSNPTTTGTNTNNDSAGNWYNIASNTTIGTTLYYKTFDMNNKNDKCEDYIANPEAQPNNTNGSPVLYSQSPATITHPVASVLRTYHTTNSTGTIEYRYSKNKKTCTLQARLGTGTSTVITTTTTTPITWTTSQAFSNWTYKPVTFNISGLKNTASNAWNNSVSLPVGTNGANTSIAWNGCIEERQTVRLPDSTPFDEWSPAPTAAYDMDIDMIPDPSNPATQWGPSLAGAVWLREDNSGNKTVSNVTTNNSPSQVSGDCPTVAKFYQGWSPTAYKNYINSITVGGNTYHDIGMLWGARLMSPTGIFADQTAPADITIQRHLIFMTDGDANTDVLNYTAYGVPWYDRRQTSVSSVPSKTVEDDNVNARTQAICAAVRARNITVWVISYGGSVSTADNALLTSCATANHFYLASNAAALTSTFKGIAAEIANLRITE